MSRGPKPFSSEWLSAPAPPPQPARRLPLGISRALRAAASRLPGEHALTVTVVLMLVLVSLGAAVPNSEAQAPAGTEQQLEPQLAAPTAMPTIEYDEAQPAPQPTITTEALTVKSLDEVAAERQASAPQLQLQQPRTPATTADGLLPEHRILTYYGYPGNDQLGILGEHDMDEALELMREQAAAYEEADPSRPVLLAFEVIASVAQGKPQADGSYLLDAPTDMLDEYADFAEENDILLILDVQIGRRTVMEEIEGLRPWLEKPFVHLALDPEFAMREGEIPGKHIGQIDASDIADAQNWLVELTEKADIPPKVLIVHQFHYTMIENKEQAAPVEGVQLVIDADGWGTPEEKRATYDYVNRQLPIEYAGVKLFYSQDVPLMTPEEILALNPIPDLIIYH